MFLLLYVCWFLNQINKMYMQPSSGKAWQRGPSTVICLPFGRCDIFMYYYLLIHKCSVLLANAAFIAIVAAKHGLRVNEGRDFATKQLGYMLGDTGRSFVIGFGNNPPQRPHHRSSYVPQNRCRSRNLNITSLNFVVPHESWVRQCHSTDVTPSVYFLYIE